MEVAIGASMAGAAAICSMKHVGVNIASDPLMTFTFSKLNGPMVIAVGDDPGANSSQNEQDSRMWAEYGFMPMVQPGSSQEAYDLVRLAFDMSERFHTPAIVRMVDRTCNMTGRVVPGEPVVREPKGFEPDPDRYYMVPPYSRTARTLVEERIPAIREWMESDGVGFRSEVRDPDLGIVTFGHQYHIVRELLPEASTFKLDILWPLPVEALKAFAGRVRRVIVIEELLPFVENHLKLAGIDCEGKIHFPAYGEIDSAEISAKFGELGMIEPTDRALEASPTDVPRGAMLCPGCPHRPTMVMLRDLGIFCHGDIGCYLMGSYPPFDVLKTSISMGASIGIAQGMSKALEGTGKEIEPMVSVIGDSTLLHSGLPSVINYGYNRHNTKLLVLDNRSTSMTGLQDNPVTGKTVRGEQGNQVDIEETLRALGIGNVTKVNQYNMKQAREVFEEKLKKEEGPLAVIATGPCALKYKVKHDFYYVDPEVCIACRTCVKVGCPPIGMHEYPGREAGDVRSYIDATRCVGCSVCFQVCPVKAIKRSKLGETPPVPLPLDLQPEPEKGE